MFYCNNSGIKRRVLGIFITILAVFTLTGCGGKGEEQVSDLQANNLNLKEVQKSTSDSQDSQAINDSQIGELPQTSLNASWPTDTVPAELPEYTEGEVTASGEDSGTLYIKIKDTDISELYTYLDTLKEAGWIVTTDDTEAEAVLGTYTVSFDLQGGGSYLQIAVYTTEVGEWPTDDIPSDIIPPHIGTLADEIEILEQIEGAWYFNYTYDGVDEAAASLYMQTLRENGWEGDDYTVSKSFEWKGKMYGASIEVYETLETRTTFTCNYWLN